MQYIKPPSHYRILKGLVLAAKRLGEPMAIEDIRRRRIEGAHIHRATMIKAGDTAMQVYHIETGCRLKNIPDFCRREQ